MTDCPPGDAILRHPSGEVYIVKDRCIACGNCANNCPYDNIFMYHPEETAAPSSHTSLSLLGIAPDEAASTAQANPETARGFAIKCDLCQGITGGPACVRSCPTGALERLRRGAYDDKIISLAAQRRHEIH
jgi:Fe-S-cluster-containing hydrogenase component 2